MPTVHCESVEDITCRIKNVNIEDIFATMFTMIADGRTIASTVGLEIEEEIKRLKIKPTLLVIQVGSDPASSSFIRMKKRFGESHGVHVVVEQHETISPHDLIERIEKANGDSEIHGIVVQLPLPSDFDTQTILDAIDQSKDPDLLSSQAHAIFENGDSLIVPPVAAAARRILEQHNVDLVGKKIAVIGAGKLVGKPISAMLNHMGFAHDVVDLDTLNSEDIQKNADVILSGVGKAGLIKAENIKDGVVIIDAGTSEDPKKQSPSTGSGQAARLSGDAEEACRDKASLITPVPGGVGPVAVSMLFSNLITLIRNSQRE